MLSPLAQFDNTYETPKYSYQDFSSEVYAALTNSEESPGSPEEQYPSPPVEQLPQKKKPGRKPNPASPAVRKAQNRAAQRAFRERKERHLKELEVCVKELRDNQHNVHSELQRENQKLRYLIQILKNDNVQLRSIISGFGSLTEKASSREMISPANGIAASSFIPSSGTSMEGSIITPVPLARGYLTPTYQEEPNTFSGLSSGNGSDPGLYGSPCASRMDCYTPASFTSYTHFDSETCSFDSSERSLGSQTEDDLQQDMLDGNIHTVFPDGITLTIPPPDFGRLSGGVAISLIPEVREPKYMFKHYDSRIDKVPSEKLKELMIEQQGNYDLDELWDLFMTKAICHGDPQDPSAWELPDEFYTRFPMLVDPALKARERMRTAWWRLNGRIKAGDKIRSFV
ncbi:hypothetical protein K493DRAFT_387591 [Basidiobolus meristosporus CBS 931.73]|uniref:BZIP domain-containing protein n=1 Tax=Basidiobolus meristosporus CBS 931.73 TaxID=1314790 RepID=A0A1Y1XEF2_9FUNG|nr:hypothetical protein K493DRAFT_387591 [Basidiobolus meristosporus CBS 931.73]|eukprot:ORX84062.1 hypothetical protein K493DRAFT_387591 [Basidiobolus meristosporus CBS 931.73]